MVILNKSTLMRGCRGEVEMTIPIWESHILITIMIFILLVSLLGNSLILLSTYKVKQLQTKTNALICSLAVTDLVSPLTRLLFIIISMFRRRWIFGCDWCFYSSQWAIWFGACSIEHLCAVSIERYITINYPYRSKEILSKCLVSIGIVAVWMTSLVLSLFPTYGIVEVKFHSDLLGCEMYLANDPKLAFLVGLFFFALPVLIMIIVYGNIFLAVRIQTKRLFIDAGMGSKEQKQKQRFLSELKAVKTVLIIIGLFFILYLPYFCGQVMNSYSPGSFPGWLKRVSLCLLYTNSCCNWIVYGLRNKNFRKAFIRILHINSGTRRYKKRSTCPK